MKKYLLSFLLMSSVFMLNAQVTSVGIIGPASPNGDWDTDFDMVQSPTDTAVWTLTATLNAGVLKFRANDAWDINWGALDFPSGVGTQGGADIPVFAGDYDITFNHVTGEYNFELDSDMGLIGPATPNADWDTDVNMYKDTGDVNKFFLPVSLTAGECKFRKDDAWDRNWGNDSIPNFPSGIVTVGGGNITVDANGDYMVTLDTLTGEYNFEALITYETIGLIGSGTSIGDWDTDVDLVQSESNPNEWSAPMTLQDGEVKFRANDDWGINWGGTDFPEGVGVPSGMDNIPVTAGDYFVFFNTETFEYRFLEIVEYNSMGIIGDATEFGDWDTEVALEQDPMDPHSWSLRADLSDGEAKFRANMDWGINWGGADFPSGVAQLNGTINFPITGGDYVISFNSLTGAYNFEEVVEYDSLGLIGMSGPNADWDTDVWMTKDPNDFNIWTIASATVTDKDPAADDQGVKFRADGMWTVNWGAADFPAGVGTQDGDNIPTVAGTYGIVFNSLTGEYLFGDELSSTEDIIDPSTIKIYPNPTDNLVNVDLSSLEISGNVNVLIFDMNGRLVKQYQDGFRPVMQVEVDELQTGSYLLQISNKDYIVGKRLSILK